MNFVVSLLLSCGASFLFLCLVFRPLELAFPAKPGGKFFRPHWGTDLCFFIGQYLLFSGAVYFVLSLAEGWLQNWIPSGWRTAVGQQAWWLQAIEVVFLSDFFIYWGHRLQHRVGWLWRFHAIHHTAEHLDWLAAHREHPVDTIYTMGLINLPAFLLGFPLETLAGLIAFRGIWAIYIHSNVRLPIGPLRILIGAPELHHWHHDRDRDAGNYANISPLMDWLFGTYRCPDHEPESFGLREPIAQNYFLQLAHPFLPQRRAERAAAGSVAAEALVAAPMRNDCGAAATAPPLPRAWDGQPAAQACDWSESHGDLRENGSSSTATRLAESVVE
ncbi:MAG TPA: sterol desaturase family protein [Pirellulales bacterium]|nr:sterol desaturase family protein [Pirellulales bacterium]